MNIDELKQQTADAFKALEDPRTNEIIKLAIDFHSSGQSDSLNLSRDHMASAQHLTKLLGLSLHVCHMLIANANEASDIAKPASLPIAPFEPLPVRKTITPIAPTGNVEAPAVTGGGVPAGGSTATQENPSLLQQVLNTPT